MNSGIESAGPGRRDDTLGESLRAARARLLAVYAELPAEYWEVGSFPYLETINPPLWEIAHVAWFQEYWCLRYERSVDRAVRPSLMHGADECFDSRRVAHRDRWAANYPSRSEVDQYLRQTLALVTGMVEQGLTAEADGEYFARLSLHHEQMHAEALLMTLRSLGLRPPASFPGLPEVAARDAWLTLPAGRYAVGAGPSATHFIFDNEKSAHCVELDAFRISRRPVLAIEFDDFVRSGGYESDDFWTPHGLVWRNSQAASARDHEAIRRVKQAPAEPVCNVTLHEAQAYCKWAGCRLPLEKEWEVAARHGNGLDATGLVWEWTSSPFEPYPGFSPDPYREYSQPWFSDHFVLRGGSWLTHPDLKRPGFRNFYQPHRNDVFAGFRTCAV